ncbi:MAG: energy-coupling factor transporter transmembrane protein EcfT [Peptococcaceae bacterium]|nr:energy-coupling factor transporter transmembrane protein EcfT [Peptococcaceae bacterium]MBQ2994729.1 energy-coupling factor transporter transmembrane protein EcfT [Peptococcaceae bacterium]
MLGDITIGQYYPADSVLHKLDPRTKILAILVYMVSLFIVNNFYGLLGMMAISILVVTVSKVPIKYFFRGLKMIIFIVLLTVALQMFMTPGEVIWQWSFLKITKEGIRQAVFMGTRLVLLISITSILTLTTTPIALTDGIERLLKPFQRIGVPAHELAMMMSIALRFIPTLVEETDKIMKAQAARGANFDTGNLIEKVKALVPLLVPLFLSAFQRADELAIAMEARCYHGGTNRTRLKALQYTRKDLAAGILCVCMVAAAIISRTVS